MEAVKHNLVGRDTQSITHNESACSPVCHGRCLAGMHNVGSPDMRSVCRSVNTHQTLPVHF